MPPIRLHVHLGRVTSRDASQLLDGELTLAQDAYYKLNSPTLWKVPGRAEFNSSAESAALKGAVSLTFDDAANDLFVVMRGTAYRKAPTGLTGSFSDLAGFDASSYALAGTATTLDAVHYTNEHILLNGVDRNRLVRSSGDQMFHGMLAAAAPPALSRDGGGGTGFILTTSKTITYWIEERVKVGTAIVKRSASAAATTVTLTGDGSTDKPLLTRPNAANPDATHWALFATATNGAFPTGAEIAEAPIATLTIEDTRTGTDPGLPAGAAYLITTATVAGLTSSVPTYGPPPIASTGDIFEDSVVLNDESDPSLVVFSPIDTPHAFPSLNKFRIGDVKKRDEVRVIRTLDNFCVILGKEGAYRILTLPRPTDSQFAPERAKARIRGAQGVVGPLAAALFSFGQGERLAYVSPPGIVATDGLDWDVVTDDVDWENEVETSLLSLSFLVDNPRFYRLEFFYVPKGGSRPTACMFLHYHPSHVKGAEGNPRAIATWPVSRDANAVFSVKISGLDEFFSANENGKLYRHDVGTSEPVVTGGIQFKARTRDIYPLEVGRTSVVRTLYAHHQAAPAQTALLVAVQRNPASTDEITQDYIPLDFREATQFGRQPEGECFQFGLENSDTLGSIGLDYFVGEFESHGLSEEP